MKRLGLVIIMLIVLNFILATGVSMGDSEYLDAHTPPKGYVPIPTAEKYGLATEPSIQGVHLSAQNSDGQVEAYGSATALLIQDVYPWAQNSNELVLQEFGITYDVANSNSLSSWDLKGYRFVVYASDQPTSYYTNIAANIGKINEFVSAGGLLIAHVCDYGWNSGDWRGLSILPGNVSHKTGWDSRDYISQSIHITDPSHKVVAGLDDAYFANWNYSTHGILTGLLGGTNIVMMSNDGILDGPTYIAYDYGAGKVLATMQTVEWAYFNAGPDRPEFLRNEIRFAQQPAGGKFQKGDIVRSTANDLKVRNDEHEETGKVHAGYGGEILGPHKVAEVGGVDYTFWKIEWRWKISEDNRNGRVPLAEKITGWSAENWLLENDVYWLAKMLTNEASVGEELEQVAVGWTLLHRLSAGRFGNDLEQVVSNGYGQYWVNVREPTNTDIVRLAERLLRGEEPDPTNGATHFFSPRSQTLGPGPYPVPGTSNEAFYAYWAGPIVGWEVITITDPDTGEEEEAERIVVLDPSGERETTDTRRYVTDRWHILAENTIRYYTPLGDFTATEFEWTPLAGIENWYFMFYRPDRQRISAVVASPVELRVYDSEGRVSGLVDGITMEEIPGSECFNNTVIVHYPVGSYGFEVVGADEGSYGLTITTVARSGNTAFTAIDIPTGVRAVHQYSIDWIALLLDEKGVTVMVDADDDGVFEHCFTTGSELTGDEFVLKTETILTIDPETLNLQAPGKWITAYIELPEGYAAEDIDIGMVQLLYSGSELHADWGDLQDGVFMAKFDWATVAGWFEGLHDEEVELTVAGEVNGIEFEGTGTIRVIDPPRPRRGG